MTGLEDRVNTVEKIDPAMLDALYRLALLIPASKRHLWMGDLIEWSNLHLDTSHSPERRR